MEIYRNVSGDSGVDQYEIGDNFIKVQFSTGAQYLYTYSSAGMSNIEHMKKLAKSGDGLNAFINTHVKKLYERKL